LHELQVGFQDRFPKIRQQHRHIYGDASVVRIRRSPEFLNVDAKRDDTTAAGSCQVQPLALGLCALGRNRKWS
jgi:hypothetical protein